MKIKSIYKIGLIILPLFIVSSCDMTEEIPGEITSEVVQSDPGLLPNMVAPPLGQLRKFWQRERVWGLQEATSDECFFPTRGQDWFDLGVWQADYLLTWTPMHRDVIATWNDLNSAISSANTALFNIGKPKVDEDKKFANYRATAIFLRTFYEYNLYDLYRSYPTRDPYSTDFLVPPTIYQDIVQNNHNGFNRLVTIAKATLPDMLSRANAKYGEPNADAGLMLLAKLYLNKEVYTGTQGYDSCLIYLNQLIGNYSLADNYFKMFSPDNDQNFKKADDEAIFVCVYSDDANYGVDDQVQWVKTVFHYNQAFGEQAKWNGCSAPKDYLMDNWISGTDTATDTRWKNTSTQKVMGFNLGFNYGQQYDYKTGAPLEDRNGNPLIFSFEVNFTGADESQGVRVLKYPPRDVPVNLQRCPNDFLIWRYADALLMKAECLARAGNTAEALTIVNQIRTKRGAPVLASLVLNDILAERGRELYWEGHRRQDMIRFGTFLLPKTEKTETSPATAIVLPVPQPAIDGTPGGLLKQNPGY